MMKPFQQWLRAVTFAVAAAFSISAFAQADKSTADLTEAEVRKVDKENRKVTLKHGAIKNLDMPPMTMVFGVGDPALLDKLQPGDKVRFKAINDAGKFTVTEMQPFK